MCNAGVVQIVDSIKAAAILGCKGHIKAHELPKESAEVADAAPKRGGGALAEAEPWQSWGPRQCSGKKSTASPYDSDESCNQRLSSEVVAVSIEYIVNVCSQVNALSLRNPCMAI